MIKKLRVLVFARVVIEVRIEVGLSVVITSAGATVTDG